MGLFQGKRNGIFEKDSVPALKKTKRTEFSSRAFAYHGTKKHWIQSLTLENKLIKYNKGAGAVLKNTC